MSASIVAALWCAWSAAIVWLSGALLARVGRATREPLSATVATDAVLGLTVVAALGTLQVMIGSPVARWPVYAVLIIAAAAVLAGPAPAAAASGASRERVVTLLLLVAAVGVCWPLWVAQHDVLWWDGWAIWEGTLPSAMLAVPGPYDYAHPHYPIGVPLVTAWTYAHVGAASGVVASTVGALWFAVLVGYAWEILRRRVPAVSAALATAAIAWLDPVASHAVGGTAEVAMTIALLGVVDAVTAPPDDTRAVWRGGTALLLGVLAKQEGLALAIIAGGALALTWRASPRTAAWRWAGATLVPLVVWLCWQATVAQASASRLLPAQSVSWSSLGTRITDVLIVSGTLLTDGWWWPVCLLATAGLVRTARAGLRWLGAGWVVVVGYLLALVAVYLVTSYDHVWLLRTSFVRVMSVTLPSLVVLSLCAVAAPLRRP
jgi:hypothetical protein